MIVLCSKRMSSLDSSVEKAFVDVREGMVLSGDYWLLQDAIEGGYLHEDASVRELTREVRMRMLYDGKLVIYDRGPERKVVFAFPEAAGFGEYESVAFRDGRKVE